MKYKKIMIFAFCLFLFVGNVFSQQINFDSFKRDDVNAFDRLIMNPYSKPLDYAGTATTGLALLLPAILLTAPSKDYWKIVVEYAETFALAYGVKELCKFCVNRARPYMYFYGAPENKILEGDWNKSFISGHTTLSFAAAGFTSFLFCKYFSNSPWKIPVIVSSFALASLTAGLRLASGNHFMTDVLCGAVIGTGIGILVPFLNSLWIKPSYKSEKVQVTGSPMGFVIQAKF